MWAVQFADRLLITEKAKRPRANRKRFPARAGTQLMTFFQTVQIAGKRSGGFLIVDPCAGNASQKFL
jgi:hypothetical protein